MVLRVLLALPGVKPIPASRYHWRDRVSLPVQRLMRPSPL